MASRTRNRILGIAALVGATVVAVVILIVSQGADRKVTPLREDAATRGPSAKRADDAPIRFRPAVPVARPSASRAKRHGARDRRSARRRGGHRTVRVRSPETTRPARSNPKFPRIPSGTTPPAAAPTPVSAPIPPSAPAPSAAAPLPARDDTTQPGSSPQPLLDSDSVDPTAREIEIEGGELEEKRGRPHAHGKGRARLHVRSDELLIIEVEGRDLTWVLPAGRGAVIDLESPFAKDSELELRHRKGVLVLRVSN